MAHASRMGSRSHLDEVEARQTAIFRAMSPAQRLSLAVGMFRQMQSLMDAGLRESHPEWTAEQRRRAIAERVLYARTG